MTRLKYTLKVLLQQVLRFFLLPFRLFPIRRNRILFLSLEGGSDCEYSCSPRYFCEYLLRKVPGQYDLVWLFRNPKRYAFLKKQGIRTARHFTPRGLYLALTARAVITNGGYLTWFPFRPGQVCINTWHAGGAYKRLENDRAGAGRATAERMRFASKHTTAFISSCREFSRHEIRGAFLYRGKILPIGLPRNDLFFSPVCGENYRKVRTRLHLSAQSRLLLYAPTFREETHSFLPFPAAEVRSALEKASGERWTLLCRTHTQAEGRWIEEDPDGAVLDVSGWPDTQELLCAADLLVTDYSSILWDFSLTSRPVLLYVPDLDEYRSDRGFYRDIEEWGFPLCRTPAELCRALGEALNGSFSEAPARHLARFGSYESGQACEKLWQYLRPFL